MVSLAFDPMVVNGILCGEMDKDELEVDVAVKKSLFMILLICHMGHGKTGILLI